MLIRPGQRSPKRFISFLPARQSKSIQPLPSPSDPPRRNSNCSNCSVPVAPLPDLVQMKLNSFRPKDFVHLETLDVAGLISLEIEAISAGISQRLREAREQFERDEPDGEE